NWTYAVALLALAGIPLVFFGDARFHVPVMPLLVVPAAWLVGTCHGGSLAQAQTD
ncbi:MAG: hypothetical protein IH787_06840, partial [Nitrospirae bacterium]|nr:hypothetical protein [Nitrospirota bacterium]